MVEEDAVEVDPIKVDPIEVDPVEVDPVVEVDPIKVSKYDRPGSWESEIQNQIYLSPEPPYIHAKYTLKTDLARSDAEINGFLGFDHFLSVFWLNRIDRMKVRHICDVRRVYDGHRVYKRVN